MAQFYFWEMKLPDLKGQCRYFDQGEIVLTYLRNKLMEEMGIISGYFLSGPVSF